MSEERDDRTEAASARRLQQARDEGQIPLGRDLGSFASTGAAALALMVLGPRIARDLVALLATASQGLGAGAHTLPKAEALDALASTFAVCLASALASLVATIGQTSGGFWPELAMPDFTRLGQVSRLTRLFKLEGLADMGLALLKLGVIAAAAWTALRADFLTLATALQRPSSLLLATLLAPLLHAAGRVVGAMALLAGVDLAVTRYRFAVRMRMTREEAKREHREDEGDPLLRSRRRRRHRELAKANARAEVPKADVLVVNPTHVAVALKYRRGEDRAPRVIAKGKGQLAEVMREVARANGVPIVEEIPLARLLYKRVKVGREVPAETFRAVAAVLAFVYRVTGARAQRSHA